MKKIDTKFISVIPIFLVVAMLGCSGMKNTADQKKYQSSLDEVLVAVNNAIGDAGLNLKGSIKRDDGSILLTAVELTNMYGSGTEPVQTMSLDIIVDKVDEKTVMVEIETPHRQQYVMAGSSQTATSEFREKIFASLERSIGSIKTK